MNPQKFKNIIIIGSMKCGTTSLFNYLKQHPEIAESITKELEFFSLKKGFPEFKTGSYIEKFEIDTAVHKFTLEASTGYTKHPDEQGVADRIKDYDLNPYFIYIVRNPFDRIRSHYNYMQKDLSWKFSIDSPQLIHTSNYSMQLQQYTPYFSKDRILVLDFDQLKQNPVTLCHRIFNFVGASNFQIDKNIQVDKTSVPHKKQVILAEKTRLIRKLTPQFINRIIKGAVKIIFPDKTTQTQLTKDQKETIKNHLKEDMLQLKHEYKIEIEKWGF